MAAEGCMSAKELNVVLQGVVDRNASQKLVHIARLRAELHDLGYSIVTTEWLNAVFSEMPVENLERVAREVTE
jgi:hypothetical protein